MGNESAHQIISRSIPGVPGGLTATAAMSAVLAIADRAGIMQRQPPRIIVEHLLPGLNKTSTNIAAVLSHVGYGTAAGVGYTAVTAPRARNAWTGATYGFVVWAAGYEGWLPLLGILPPAHRDAPGRALTMLAAHIVYGAVLGGTTGLQRPHTSPSA